MAIDYAAERGRRFISIGPTGSFAQTPPNTGSATGAGNSVAYVADARPFRLPTGATWDIVVGGTGSLSALSVALEISVDNGTTWRTLDTSTNTTGETRPVTYAAIAALRAKINTYTAASGTPVVTVGITA